MPKYRDVTIPYRSATTPYRTATPPIPGVDLDRLDYIRVYVVDMYGNRLAPISASVIKKVLWELNGSGSCDVDMAKLDPGTRKMLIPNELQVVFTNTTPHEMWWGFIANQQRKPAINMVTLEGIKSYLKYRVVGDNQAGGAGGGSQLYTSVEQFDIAWGLISTAQNGTNYNRNITASYSPSGVIRSRNYSRDQHKIVYDELNTFDADKLLNGFDHDIVVNETGQRLWTPYYPSRGTWYHGYLEWGKNMVDYDLKDDFLQMRTKMYCTGGSSGGAKFEQSYEDVAASAKYGAMVGTVNDGSEMGLDFLLAKAQQQVSARRAPIPDWSFTMINNATYPILGQIHPGDQAWVKIDDEANQINMPIRVGSIEWLQNETVVIKAVQPNLTGFVTPGAQPGL